MDESEKIFFLKFVVRLWDDDDDDEHQNHHNHVEQQHRFEFFWAVPAPVGRNARSTTTIEQHEQRRATNTSSRWRAFSFR